MCDLCKETTERLKNAHGIEHALFIAAELNVRHVVELMQRMLGLNGEDVTRINSAIDALDDARETAGVRRVGEAVVVYGQLFLSTLAGLLEEYQDDLEKKGATATTATTTSDTMQRASGGPMRGQGRDQ